MTRTQPKTSLRLSLAAVSVLLVAAACGGDDGGGSPGSGSGDGALSGQINISGSSTVEPITSLVAEKFQTENPDVSTTVDGPGTTDGFVLFCKGETQISDASRPIDPAEEVPACKKNGIDFIELKVGIDGLTMMTSPANDAVSCVDFNDIYALLGPESQGFETWSDANQLGRELGARGVPYPDVPLDVIGPGEESGTWGSLIDLVIGDIAEERGVAEDKAETTRPDYQASANDNVIVQGIEGSDSSFGWVGFAFAEQNPEGIKELEVDCGDGCIAPTTETIGSKRYPLSRDLFIYVNADDATRPAVKAFVDFYLGEGLSSVEEVGYVQEPAHVMEQTLRTWEDKTAGTQET